MKNDIDLNTMGVNNLSISFTCRTCLATDPDQQMTSIFEENKTSGSVPVDLHELLSLLEQKIARDDGFPSKICSICLDRLVAIDNFRKQCTKVQEYLQEYFIKHRQLEETETNSSVKHPGDSEHLDPGQTRKLRSEVKAVKSEKLESSTKHTDALENDCEPKLEVNSSSDSDLSDVDASWEPHTEIKEENEVPLTGTENIKDDRVKCPICTKTFSTIASRRNHMKLHSETNAYACDECGKAFKCKRYLRIHKNTHVVGDHTCGICNEKFDNTSKYEYHFKSHTAEKKYKCRYCEKSFIYIRHRISHEKVHTKKSKSPTPKRSCLCNICGKEFKHESGLKNHMKKHDAVEKYSCDICQKEFSLKGSLKVHLLVHSNEKAYQCEQCGKKFGQVGNLNYHLALHNAKKSHKCEFCSESYLRIRDLRRHRVMVHAQTDITVKELNEAEDTGGEHETPKGAQKKPKDLPYACDLCSRSFKLPSSLASHIKVHSEDRKFVCNDCGNGFKKLEHLKMHINTVHLKTKAYSCQVCNKSFARVGDRNVHMRSHAEEKPHQCSYCGRGFHLAKALRAHTRQHTGERPFVCIICNAGFTCHKTLTSHTRKQHAGEQILSKVDEIAQAVLSAPQTEANGSSMSIVSKADTHN